MKKIYHQLSIEDWENLLNILEKNKLPRLIDSIIERKEGLSKQIEKDLGKEDFSQELGKITIKKQDDIGIKTLLYEINEVGLETIEEKLKVFRDLGIDQISYSPNNVYRFSKSNLRYEPKASFNYFSRMSGNTLTSSSRKVYTDGIVTKKDDHEILDIDDYNYILFLQNNYYMKRCENIFRKIIVDNFSFDTSKLPSKEELDDEINSIKYRRTRVRDK